MISTENNTPILEATIQKSSRDISQLELNTDELQIGRVLLTWNILEHDDGCRIQIIYMGNPNVRVSMDGIIEGQGNIEKLRTPEGIIYRREFPHSARKAFEWMEIFLLIVIPISTLLIVITAYRSVSTWRGKIGLIALILTVIGWTVIILHDALYGYMEPPFGF